MGKAASHKVGYITLAIFFAVIVCFASVTRAAAYSPDPNEVPVGDQDINDGAIGFITINGSQANATVENISDATISGGLASYKKVDTNTDNQVLFDSVTYTVEPHSKKDLVVNLACWGQVDLFKGDVLQSFAGGARYGSRLIAAVHTKDECPTVTATPSNTPSAIPTTTPVVTSTPSPTPSETPGQGGGNPTPAPTDTPATTTTNNSNPSTGGGQVLSSTIAQGGLTLPSTGSGNYDFLAFAAYILGAGIFLRKYAYNLNMVK